VGSVEQLLNGRCSAAPFMDAGGQRRNQPPPTHTSWLGKVDITPINR
jgi:hypothetical protein